MLARVEDKERRTDVACDKPLRRPPRCALLENTTELLSFALATGADDPSTRLDTGVAHGEISVATDEAIILSVGNSETAAGVWVCVVASRAML